MKDNFEEKIIAAVKDTPFDEHLVYAIACQETAQHGKCGLMSADAATIIRTMCV